MSQICVKGGAEAGHLIEVRCGKLEDSGLSSERGIAYWAEKNL